jgi:hypothetical protein
LPTFANVSFFIVDEQIDDVTVAVRSPAGTQELVWDGAVDDHGPGEVVTTVVVPVPGDESANGVWTLVVTGPSSAVVVRWSITLGSRFD